MKAKIEAIEYCLPANIVSNEQLKKENPTWDIELLTKRIGVKSRHIATENETALDLAIEACSKLFQNNQGLKEKIDALIFCTESEDYILPPDSCLLHKHFNLPENVFAFDFNLACSGYIYGLVLAEALIFSARAKNVILVTADTYSKYINKQDRSIRMLFGDGAAASWIRATENNQGIIDILCGTSGSNSDKFIIPAGGCRLVKSDKTAQPKIDRNGNVRTEESIHMDGMGILSFVNSKVPKQVQNILCRQGLTIEQVDLFIFHQASNMVLDSLQRILKIKSDRLFRNLTYIGNTVSASIPIALKDAFVQGRIKPGDKILLSGFGVGLSWGTALIRM